MKTIIAGMRDFHHYKTLLSAAQKCPFEITSVVSGGAKGVDALGERFAADHSLPIERYPADWKKHGRAAGPIRNAEMAENAEALLAIWDGKSRGTGNMIFNAKKRGLAVHVKMVSRG